MPDLLFPARWICRGLTAFAVLGLLALVLTGCASSAPTAAPGSDLLTESDETVARKRARIRLELAVGYYNNGQTTIALDELKQSIAADPTLLEAHNLRGLIYMRLNDDGKTVAAMDILAPGIGEIVGGSQREERLDKLTQRMEEMGIPTEELWWYLDTRRFGTVPHAGFGLGFERMVLFVTGMTNIRDVIPFPRTPKNAEF